MALKKKEKKSFIKKVIGEIKKKSSTSKIRENMGNILEIPSYLIDDSSKVTIIDNSNILIEGYKNVEDYYSHYIKIYSNSNLVIIDGKDLDIKEITKEDLIISGEIFSVNFEKK